MDNKRLRDLLKKIDLEKENLLEEYDKQIYDMKK